MPRVAAVLLVVALGFGVILGLGAVMGRQATRLAANLPTYKATVAEKLQGLRVAGGVFDRVSGVLQELGSVAAPAEGPPDAPSPEARRAGGGAGAGPGRRRRGRCRWRSARPDPTPFDLVQRVAEPLLAPLATLGIVVILVIFILLYREDLRDRLIRLAGARDLHRTLAAMDDAAYRLSRYFLAQVGMNAAFGVFIAAALWLIGIPNPVLWGFDRRRHAVRAVHRRLHRGRLPDGAGAGGGPWLVVAALGAGAVRGERAADGAGGGALVFGHSTGLSPIAVIGAAAFWTWLWGSVGLLLAVPLTVCLVVLGRHVEQLEFLEVMLGDQPALDPEEIFYQRALAGDADALADQAEACLRAQRLPEYLDSVALPALALAQADAAPRHADAGAAGARGAERGDAARGPGGGRRGGRGEGGKAAAGRGGRRGEGDAPAEGDARDRGGGRGGGAAPSVPAPWRAPGALLCLPGRGPFDSLLATMVGQALARRGFGVQVGGQGDDARRAAAAAVPLPGRGRGERGGRPLPAAPRPPATAGGDDDGAGVVARRGRGRSGRAGSGRAIGALAPRAEHRGSGGLRDGNRVRRRHGPAGLPGGALAVAAATAAAAAPTDALAPGGAAPAPA